MSFPYTNKFVVVFTNGYELSYYGEQDENEQGIIVVKDPDLAHPFNSKEEAEKIAAELQEWHDCHVLVCVKRYFYGNSWRTNFEIGG